MMNILDALIFLIFILFININNDKNKKLNIIYFFDNKNYQIFLADVTTKFLG